MGPCREARSGAGGSKTCFASKWTACCGENEHRGGLAGAASPRQAARKGPASPDRRLHPLVFPIWADLRAHRARATSSKRRRRAHRRREERRPPPARTKMNYRSAKQGRRRRCGRHLLQLQMSAHSLPRGRHRFRRHHPQLPRSLRSRSQPRWWTKHHRRREHWHHLGRSRLCRSHLRWQRRRHQLQLRRLWRCVALRRSSRCHHHRLRMTRSPASPTPMG